MLIRVRCRISTEAAASGTGGASLDFKVCLRLPSKWPDAKAVRGKLGLSRSQLAALMGISPHPPEPGTRPSPPRRHRPRPAPRKMRRPPPQPKEILASADRKAMLGTNDFRSKISRSRQFPALCGASFRSALRFSVFQLYPNPLLPRPAVRSDGCFRGLTPKATF